MQNYEIKRQHDSRDLVLATVSTKTDLSKDITFMSKTVLIVRESLQATVRKHNFVVQ